jgi:hypothetical protein
VHLVFFEGSDDGKNKTLDVSTGTYLVGLCANSPLSANQGATLVGCDFPEALGHNEFKQQIGQPFASFATEVLGMFYPCHSSS